MAVRGKAIKGVRKSEACSMDSFTLTFDPSWSEAPKRAFSGSYKLIPTPKGSQAKPRVGCFHNGNLVFSAGARNGCYETLLSLVDKKMATKCEKRESMLGEGHYLLVELKPDFNVDPDKTYILDTETTGVDKDSDEVLSLAIVDLGGNELFHDFIKPKQKRSWPEAQSINHISPSMVKDLQHLDERIGEIEYLLDESALIVGYNIDFDLAMLRNSGLPVVNHYTYDVMKAFADKHANGNWMKLQEAASCYGYSFAPHDALDDAKATAHIFRNMEKLTDDPVPYAEKKSGGHAKNRAPQRPNRNLDSQQKAKSDDEETAYGCGCVASIAILVVVAITALAATLSSLQQSA